MYICTKKQIHQCNICDIIFQHKSKLANHMKTHTKFDAQTCLSCGEVFRRKDYFSLIM